jgi:hypothetical protein
MYSQVYFGYAFQARENDSNHAAENISQQRVANQGRFINPEKGIWTQIIADKTNMHFYISHKRWDIKFL